MENTIENTNESTGLKQVIATYTRSLVILSQYDSRSLEIIETNKNVKFEITYDEAVDAIRQLKVVLINKKAATDLFGNPKDNSFQGILGSIVQTFDGNYLYSSIEEQAAHLLYFIIKNHPFSDGNKRIGAFLFVWFLDKNKHLRNNKSELKINDNALVALALLVAQSDPADMELMIKLIVNLISA